VSEVVVDAAVSAAGVHPQRDRQLAVVLLQLGEPFVAAMARVDVEDEQTFGQSGADVGAAVSAGPPGVDLFVVGGGVKDSAPAGCFRDRWNLPLEREDLPALMRQLDRVDADVVGVDNLPA
jgi:hypothetical protein